MSVPVPDTPSPSPHGRHGACSAQSSCGSSSVPVESPLCPCRPRPYGSGPDPLGKSHHLRRGGGGGGVEGVRITFEVYTVNMYNVCAVAS